MRFPRLRSNPVSAKETKETKEALKKNVRNEGPEQLIEAWKKEINRDQPNQHCLAFLKHGHRKKSILDDDYDPQIEASNKVVAAAEEIAKTIAKGDDEEREGDSHPMAMLEMKEKTLKLVSKGKYPVGDFLWEKAEEVLRVWVKQRSEESVHLSIILLDRMVEEHERAPKWSDGQMMYWLKAVIRNWDDGQRANNFQTFTPKDMIEQVEAWYTFIELDPEIFSSLIEATIFTQPYLADSLLRRTVNSRQRGLIYSNTYNQVIRAWVDAGDPYQAEALLDFMLNEWQNRGEAGGSIAAKPNRQTFHLVLLGWANSNESVAADRTEHILDKMEKFSKLSSLSTIKPNASTYKWVLDSLIKTSDRTPEENAQRAQRIIEKLQDKANRGDEDFRPTTDMYCPVIAAWGNAGNPDKAEELLHRLYKDYCERNHDTRLQPNLDIFNNLLLAWSKVSSKSQRQKAGERAEAILEHMEKLASSNVLPGVKPNLQSYNVILSCWSRYGNGERAQKLLERMIQRWESGDAKVAPDTVSYSRVLSAWERAGNYERCRFITNVLLKQFQDLRNYRVHPNLILAGLAKFGQQPDALRKAKQLMQQMEDLYLSGKQKELRPNTTSYAYLLECVCKADRSQSGAQAESILAEMLDKYAAGDKDVKPNVAIYNNVMKTLVKTKEPKRTEEILAKMYEEDIRGSRVYPNLETFNIILSAWAKSGLGDEASRRGEQILRRLERIHESRILTNVKPNVVSYNYVLDCLAQSSDQHDAGERADRILKRMMERGVAPNAISYNHVIVALKNSGNLKRAKFLLKALERRSFPEDDDAMTDSASIKWF